MAESVYQLYNNFDHIWDVDCDACLRPFPDLPEGRLYHNQAPNGSLFSNMTEPIEFPDRIEFDAYIDHLPYEVDYLSTDVDWPIMSKRMLNTLLDVSHFPHRTYPVVMCTGEEVFDEELDKRVVRWTENHNYVAVQLTEHLDVFDHENSVFKYPYKDRKDIVNFIEKLVLKEPEGGFPPLFKVAPIKLDLFVSSAARAALETANIRGVDFWDLEDYL